MKTNVVMIRTMGGFQISQRTKDSKFYATSLLKQWNKENDKKKEVNDFLKLKSTNEFIEHLKKEEEFINGESPVLKIRGKNAGTWMHPILFIDFAMWINPSFKYSAIKFVYDELIKNRHLAGDNYNALTSAGIKLKGYNYAEVAKAIQWIVRNKTEKNWRNKATEEELRETSDIQKKLAFAIDMGYIKSYDQLIKELRKLWKIKNEPF